MISFILDIGSRRCHSTAATNAHWQVANLREGLGMTQPGPAFWEPLGKLTSQVRLALMMMVAERDTTKPEFQPLGHL
jgi:hypothetical protein